MKSNRQSDMLTQGHLRIYAKGIVIASVFVLLSFAILAILIKYTNISESIIPVGILIAISVSIFISGMYTATCIKVKGWLHGTLIGFIFIMLIFLGGSLFNREIIFGVSFLYKLLIGVIAGGIGGMIGVNFK